MVALIAVKADSTLLVNSATHGQAILRATFDG
jgi:hypothetical protein